MRRDADLLCHDRLATCCHVPAHLQLPGVCQASSITYNHQLTYNDSGIRTTCQINCKVTYPDRSQTPLWTSDTLDNWTLDKDKTSWTANKCKIELSEDGSSYTIKSSTSKMAIIDVKFTKAAPGFVAGKDGTSYYGTDPKAPWGKMFHSFWPRCRVSGSILTQGGELPMAGLGIYIHALQGYRPNLAGMVHSYHPSPT